MKRVQIYPEMTFNLEEDLLLNMKPYNKIIYFFSINKIRSLCYEYIRYTMALSENQDG